MKELLKYLDQNKIATFEEINDQIEHFAYVPLDARSRPTVIPTATLASADHTLKQKGVCLVLCIPYLMLTLRSCSGTNVPV